MGLFVTNIIEGAATIYIFVIITRSLMSWFRGDIIYSYRSFFNIITALTDPFLNLIRRYFPAVAGRVDFTPLIAIFIVLIVKSALLFIINMLFYRAPVI